MRTDLRAINRADVYKNGELAGFLERTGQSIRFGYHRFYLDAGLPPVATTLPLGDQVIEVPGTALPPFFSNLLPEGVRLLGLKDRTRTSLDDEMTLLLALGRDCVGDVAIVPTGENPSPLDGNETELNVDRLLEFAWRGDDLAALAGVQEKVSSHMLTLPVVRDGAPAILKLPPPQFPLLVENEAFFLRMAEACGVRTAHGEIVRDGQGRSMLAVRRFDRTPQGGRIAQEDGCQTLEVYPGDKYRVSLRDVIQSFVAVCASPASALRDLLGQVFFSWLIGNGDLHAKNLSIQFGQAGWEPTPAYDVLSTLPYPHLDTHAALKMDGRDANLKRAGFLTFFKREGLSERAAHRRMDQILDTAPRWIDRLEEIGYAPQTTERVQKEILHRLARLKD